MKCMKCGVGIQAGQVFCEDCLADMAQHPVKPGTPVTLPRRENQVVTKRNWKRARKPEEIVNRQRRLIGVLMAVVLALSISLTVCIYVLLNPGNVGQPNDVPGQNYGTSEPVN